MNPSDNKPFDLADLRPARGRVIVQPLAESSRSKGGIHLAEISHQREKPQKGIVLAVGAGRWSGTSFLPVDVSVGDCVFYGKYSGQEFEIDAVRVLNMAEIEIFSRLAAGAFVVVNHENPKDVHLAGDYCDLCASPEEKAASERLAQQRRELVERAGANVHGIGPDTDGGPNPDYRDENEALGGSRSDDLDKPLTSDTPENGPSPLEVERERLRQQRHERERVSQA